MWLGRQVNAFGLTQNIWLSKRFHGIKADYLEDQVELEEASDAYDGAKRLVTRLLEEAG